jgi:homoserine O-acetyltransferase/O-succinyltransferase
VEATKTSQFEPPKGSIGIVSTQKMTLMNSPDELHTECGARIGPIEVAFETYGTLNEQKDNAIFICHALTGDAHAAGYHEGEEKPGWWNGFIGPDKGIDTNRYFVISANVLGGCQGTTGPASINPETGKQYGLDFPVITVRDIIDVHSAVVKSFGIKKLLGIIGGSLGGMQVLEWAVRYPEEVGAAVVVASGANLTAQGIAFNTVGRRAILADPNFKNGQYYGGEGPHYGLAIARMLAHITYLSEDSIEEKFGRRLQHSDKLAYNLLGETEFQVESYLHYQGRSFVKRFDANSYLHMTKVMDYFNLKDSYGSLEKAFADIQSRFLIVSYDTDWLFPTSQSQELVKSLIGCKKDVSFLEYKCPYGHDSFLIDVDQLARSTRPFFEQTHELIKKKPKI